MNYISIIIFILLVVSIIYVTADANFPSLWTTDAGGDNKVDFAPGEHVFIHGTGFNVNSVISIDLTRPDGAIESCNQDYCHPRYVDGLQLSNAEGDFVYEYDLDGITGEYLVYVSDGTNTAQTTFTDAIFNIKIIQPANNSFILGSVRVRGKWNVTNNPPGLLTQYNVQIVWGDGTVNNTVNINRTSNGTNPNEIFFGEFDTEPISGCVGGNDNCNISNFNHTYTNCGPFNLTAKLYRGQPPGQDAGDASATATINPGVAEVCDNQNDDDCDTFVDCADPDCNGNPACQFCGNGIVETGEQCDDGNLNNNDLCANDCTFTFCGDNITQSPNGVGLGGPFNNGSEACDDGNQDNTDQCMTNCTRTFCGDGIIQNPDADGTPEECDDGNTVGGDGCDSLCQIEPFCGDGNLDAGEQCDDGFFNTNTPCVPAYGTNCTFCNLSCQNITIQGSFCGDGIKNGPEQCDGNDLNGQTCQSLGHVNGTLKCGANCNFNFSDCRTLKQPIKDSKVSSAQKTKNFGTGRYMMINDKSNAVDRSYLGFDLSNGITSVANAILEIFVYQTGNQLIGSIIEAWYCPNADFNELTINWNNQPANWNSQGVLLAGNCTKAENFTATNLVNSGLPQTKHVWNLTPEINDALSTDKKFTIVIKHDKENFANNNRFVQYLTKEYPDANFRPKLEIS